MADEVAIRVENVSKDFVLPHEKVQSIKGMFTGLAKGRRNKTTEAQHALKDISFEVKKGEFFGIVGRNGSGKSTLLKILAGIYQPTSGKVTTRGKLVPFIELGVGFNPELTGRENVYLNGAMLGFSEQEVNAMYEDIVSFAELERFMDQKLKNYSSGMQVRLAFSVAIRANADILLVDEVLAVGDADFQRKCFGYFKQLKKNKKTVIFVTHDMNSVREYCDRAIMIEKSLIVAAGSADKIASKYTRMFIEEANKKDSGTSKDDDSDRWGSGEIQITSAKTSVKDQKIKVKVEAKVNNNLDRVIYGLHILGPDGKEITAMNNRMIHVPDVEHLIKGKNVEFTWDVLNVFNEGDYSLTLTLVDSSGNVFDWLVNAATFTIHRTDRSTTAVLPPVDVTYRNV